jgi:thiosulfate dehydrogenase [quinone] large subunit
MTRLQQISLVLLRTLIGWHFLYEGYYKLVVPAWGRDGHPLAHWTAAGYLRASSGPFATLFRPLADSPLTGWIDQLIPIALVLVGLSLILGLFTQAGCWGALGLLTMFYVSAIPTTGLMQPAQEGAYLLVSKNLIEWVAVLALLSFRTGRVAGLDLLRARRAAAPVPAAGAASPSAA